VARLLADDVGWHVPGASAIAGEYRGREEVLAYFARRRELVDASFRMTVHRVLVDDEGVVAFTGGRARRGGRELTWETIGVYRIADGLVADGRLVPFDQAEFDGVWS
jgi:uncharacterized protein